MFDFWILGINARNLLYIKKFNPKKSIRLADNKLKTKEFLKQRWIPVPETFAVINNRKELFEFDRKSLPEEEFVVKPNKWSKWQWIKIVKLIENDYIDRENIVLNFTKKFSIWRFFNFIDKFSNIYDFWYENNKLKFKIWNDIYDYSYFLTTLVDILDGKYSLSEWWDKILVEEKLEPGENFQRFCRYWLADIRVIVFNLIPVAAMIRVPTQWSWWKANIAQWWVWLWIEVWSWKIKSMYFKGEIFDKKFPWWFEQFYKKKIPFWDDILLYSSKIQYFVNIWYLALDWVITDEWPKLLEINARAWLEVQNASKVYLKKRLEKISDIKVNEPEKGVEIAKSLFTTEKTPVSLTKVVYLSQKANLILEWEEEDVKVKVHVEVDLNKEKNYISKDLYEKISNWKEWDIILDLFDSEVRFKNILFELDEKLPQDRIVLGYNILQDYYIKPIRKEYVNISFINPDKIIEEEVEKLQLLDSKIHKIHQKLNLTKILYPVNYLDELDNFITWGGNYNPKFKYNRPEDEKLNALETELFNLRDKYFGQIPLKSKFSSIFDEKIEELLVRINLIRAYKRQKYDDILKYNIMLRWELDKDLIKLSKEKIFLDEDIDSEVLWKQLSLNQVKKIIKQYLQKKGISGVKIITDASISSRISIARTSKRVVIRLSPFAKFREKEIYATLAHEIDIHLLRWLNWKKTGWYIFSDWTGFYLKDEEGLAVWNSFKYLPEWYEKKWMYFKYYFILQAQKNHFARLAEIYRWYIGWDLMKAFKWVFRVKKGIKNTWFVDSWAIWMKDKVYLDWYNKLDNWVRNWWDVNKMMIWKIKVEDIYNIF